MRNILITILKKFIFSFLCLLPFMGLTQKSIEYVLIEGMYQKVEIDSLTGLTSYYHTLLDSTQVRDAIYGDLESDYDGIAKRNTAIVRLYKEVYRKRKALTDIGLNNFNLYRHIYLDTQLFGAYKLIEQAPDGTINDRNVTFNNWKITRNANDLYNVQAYTHSAIVLTKINNGDVVFLSFDADINSFVGMNGKGEFITLTKR